MITARQLQRGEGEPDGSSPWSPEPCRTGPAPRSHPTSPTAHAPALRPHRGRMLVSHVHHPLGLDTDIHRVREKRVGNFNFRVTKWRDKVLTVTFTVSQRLCRAILTIFPRLVARVPWLGARVPWLAWISTRSKLNHPRAITLAVISTRGVLAIHSFTPSARRVLAGGE
eukprot:6083728-Pyramimonas_sp.AAC.1